MRFKALAVTLLLTVNLTSAASAASIKSGSKCNSEGSTRISAGKKFVCEKKNGKLTWSSKKESKKATPKVRTRFEILADQETPQGRSLREFLKYPRSKTTLPSPVEYVFSPNSEPSYQNVIKGLVNTTFNYFSEFFKDSRKFPIVYASDDDFEWFIDYLTKNKLVNEWLPIEYRSRLKQEGVNVNIGGSDIWGDNQNQINILRGKKRPPVQEADRAFIAHEFTHAVQNYLAGGQSNMPCWTAEGAASFFGNAISARNYQGSYERMKYWNLQMVGDAEQKLFPWSYTDAQWLDAFKRLEKRGDLCAFEARISYGIGIAMTEIMVADKGVKTLMDWWATGNTSEGWRNGFERLYGINLDTWYQEKALPYVKETYAKNSPDRQSP